MGGRAHRATKQAVPGAGGGPRPLKRIVFVCVGNMCRSQMAEGLARHMGAGELAVESAGTRATGEVSREAIAVMQEIGIGLEGQRSKGLSEADLASADVIVSMAPESAALLAPRGFRGVLRDWDVGDPIGLPLEAFRIVRQDLQGRVERLVRELGVEPAPLPGAAEGEEGGPRESRTGR